MSKIFYAQKTLREQNERLRAESVADAAHKQNIDTIFREAQTKLKNEVKFAPKIFKANNFSTVYKYITRYTHYVRCRPT